MKPVGCIVSVDCFRVVDFDLLTVKQRSRYEDENSPHVSEAVNVKLIRE